MTVPKLRIVRPTDNIDALMPFYRDGLGLSILYRFERHDGFSGAILGREDAPYHFAFTKADGHVAGKAPTQDNLLVFYIPQYGEWEAAVARMKLAGFAPVQPFNPYWDTVGKTFEDADGYRIVLQNDAWTK